MNNNESLKLPRISLGLIRMPKVGLTNVFGITSKVLEVVDNDAPYLLLEDGSSILWEDGSRILLEQDKIKIWRQKARK